MKFNNITGVINKVSLSIYDDLISAYVEKVKNIKGVKSIIQIGSFTAPGLSDIDIIVIVDDKNPPKWEEISIKKILKGKEGFEVIAHDVFIYPENLSKYIEGLFYIDRKKILFGKDIGGKLSIERIQQLKLILTFEYTIHRLETLVVLTSLPSVKVRDILLFISTLRHTYKLLHDFDIIPLREKDKRISQIEELRILSLDNEKKEFREKLNIWIIPSFKAIYESALLLGEKLNYNQSNKLKSWVLNHKKLIYNIDNVDLAIKFFIKKNNFNKLVESRVLLESMPNCVFHHVRLYKQIGNQNNISFDALDSINLRHALADAHKKFINLNGYPIAKSYIIINGELPKLQNFVKKVFLKSISPFF